MAKIFRLTSYLFLRAMCSATSYSGSSFSSGSLGSAFGSTSGSSDMELYNIRGGGVTTKYKMPGHCDKSALRRRRRDSAGHCLAHSYRKRVEINAGGRAARMVARRIRTGTASRRVRTRTPCSRELRSRSTGVRIRRGEVARARTTKFSARPKATGGATPTEGCWAARQGQVASAG